MRVLGVDPGLTRCGIGVVDGAAGSVAAADPRRRRAHAGRHGPRRAAAHHRRRPGRAGRHAPSGRRRGRAGVQPAERPHRDGHGPGLRIALVAAGRGGARVALHTPTEVKAAVTGNGAADKAQVGAMVTRLLRLTETPKPADAADALGAGHLPHLARPAQNRLARAQAAAPGRHPAMNAGADAGHGPRAEARTNRTPRERHRDRQRPRPSRRTRTRTPP